jgi:hypothetical protein
MCSATVTRPGTVSDVLFGIDIDPAVSLKHSFIEHDTTDEVARRIDGLTKVAVKFLAEEVAKVASEFLDIALVELLAGGWRKHSQLVAAARRTRGRPGSKEAVRLTRHRITSTHRPRIDVFFRDRPAGTIHFELDVEFVVTSVEVVLQEGHIVALRSGACEITATFSAERQQVARVEMQFGLDAEIPLGAGIMLAPRIAASPEQIGPHEYLST